LIPIFFLSGVAALVYEALWFRLAGLSLGNSVWSATLVLAAFMGGLTLGSALVTRVHHRVARPVRLYAGLELAIGIGGFAAVLALPRLSATFGPLLAGLVDTPWLLNAARLAIAFTVLVVPATAMGATLPVLTEALSRSNPNFGANLGKLYGWNTLGAMLGALGTETVLVRVLGITATGLFAMALNLLAGLIALNLSQAHEQTAAPIRAAPRPPLSRRAHRYLIVGALSGAAMLALEVVWFRFLLLTYTGTGLAFAVMLTIVLAGIGLGGLAAGRVSRRDERFYRWLPHVSAASAALVVLTYAGFDLFTTRQIAERPTLVGFVVCASFLMLPVALLSGAAFAMVARGVQEELGSSLRAAGIVTLWNTVGSMAGSLLAGFLLLPLAGMERSFFIVAVVYAGTALLAPAAADDARRSVQLSSRASIAVAAACLAFFPFGLMQRSFFVIVQRALPEHTLIATREGLVETVRYYRRDLFGAPHFYRLVTNGYSMSGTSIEAKRYMKLYVYLPLALRPESRDALLISYGVGSTAKALTDSAALRHIDVVDISRDILEMNTIVYPGDDNPLRDERVRVHVEDGRFFLSTTERKYDLITSEPPPPKIAGVVNLYSEEYFRLIRAHLAAGGYATYWLPAHQLEPLDTLAIIKAFCGAFEDCSLWSGGGLEWMLMGSNGADRPVTEDAFSAQWRDARVRPELEALGFEAPEQMGALFMGDAQQLAAVTGEIRPVTDNYPLRLSDRLVTERKLVPFYATLMDEDRRAELFKQSSFIDRVWPRDLKKRSTPFFRYERMIKNHLTADLYRDESDPFLWEAIDDVLANTSLQTLPLWLLGTDAAAQRIAQGLARGDQPQRDIDLELALGALAHRDFATALAHTRHELGDGRNVPIGTVSLYLYLLAKNDRVAEAGMIIDAIDPAKLSGIVAFRQWFDGKFRLPAAAPQVTRADSAERIAAAESAGVLHAGDDSHVPSDRADLVER
jgi:predicted membrane-bound spermidine synthase